MKNAQCLYYLCLRCINRLRLVTIVLRNPDAVGTISVRSMNYHGNSPVFQIHNFFDISHDHSYPLLSWVQEVRHRLGCTRNICSRDKKVLSFIVNQCMKAARKLSYSKRRNGRGDCSSVPDGHADVSFFIYASEPCNNPIWLNSYLNTRAALKPPPHLEKECPSCDNRGINRNPVIWAHLFTSWSFKLALHTQAAASATVVGTGVVSDFERALGTGGGRSAQDSPNLTFQMEPS
jgi:hypothetical protein